ncbi:MAG TPA: peptide ABC transporter permease [Myxococcales bacterium]|nr:peptide ABC transporter permease [Myxococcales bacterium]
MTLGQLAFKDLLRNPTRLLLTVLATGIGVLAFVFLQTVISVFYSGLAVTQPDRLAVRSKISITQPLPLSYKRRIESVPGVTRITYAGWFGGRMSETREDFFPNFYVDKATYLKVYDEYVAPADQLAAWMADPCGAMAGKSLAERFDWQIGDRVTLKNAVYPGEWTFTVRGIYAGRTPQIDTTLFAFGYRCINERLPEELRDYVGIYTIVVDDPARSAQVAAQIDAMFANSAYPTRTESERSFQMSFIAMSSAILTAVRIVAYGVLLILLLVVGNTLAMNVREKTVDLATLRALGFRRRHVAALVLVESLVIGLAGAAVGLLLAPPVLSGFVRVVSESFGPIGTVVITGPTYALALGASVGVALLAGLLPALRAARLQVAEGLRRIA